MGENQMGGGLWMDGDMKDKKDGCKLFWMYGM